LRQVGVDVDRNAAVRAIEEQIGKPLELDCDAAAEAVVRVVTEQMIHAIEEVTVEQGVDPRSAVLVSGGGAAGFNIVAIAKRLGCRTLAIPRTGAALSATGGLLSPVFVEHAMSVQTTTSSFAFDAVNSALAQMVAYCWAGIAGTELHPSETRLELIAEARYPGQVWELELPLRGSEFSSAEDVAALEEDFHAVHEDVFAVRDAGSPIEIIGLRARIQVPAPAAARLETVESFDIDVRSSRSIYLPSGAWQEVPVVGSAHIGRVAGPAILELPGTSIVLDSGAVASRGGSGLILVHRADAPGAHANQEVLVDDAVR
jgi:N-methylhydantoinase A